MTTEREKTGKWQPKYDLKLMTEDMIKHFTVKYQH